MVSPIQHWPHFLEVAALFWNMWCNFSEDVALFNVGGGAALWLSNVVVWFLGAVVSVS